MADQSKFYQSGPTQPVSSEGSEELDSTRLSGLTTKEALLRLHDDIYQEVAQMENDFSKRKFTSWLFESISFKSELSKMRWPSVLFMIGQAVAHFIVAFILNVDNLATGWVGFQGFILTILLLFNLAVNLWDTKLRFKELLMKSQQIMKLLKECAEDKQLLQQWRRYSWNSAQARTLFIPKSPCIHQTLTYRDDSCLNLPDYLLVKGDIIHLYPGERAPSDCISLKSAKKSSHKKSSQIDEGVVLSEGQIFHTDSKNKIEELNLSIVNDESKVSCDKRNLLMQFNHARLKKANRGVDFLILTTPYIKSLRISLQRSHKRPVNSVEKECFIVSRKYFETFVIPCVFLLSTLVTAIHYGYLDLTDSDQKIKTISIAYLLLRPSLTIMPFLPWMFPCFWLFVNAYGSARILCCGEAQRKRSTERRKGEENQGYSPNWSHKGFNSGPGLSKFDNLLATPTVAGSSENKQEEDELHDLKSDIQFKDIMRLFVNLIRGESGHVWRSSSLLQVLGCLTSLCCIDKVGVISWPNPSPEKLFFLTKNESEGPKFFNSTQPFDANSADQTDPSAQQPDNDLRLKSLSTTSNDEHIPLNTQVTRHHHHNVSHCQSEVLDISQTNTCFRSTHAESVLTHQQIGLQFDDTNWRKYLSNLKPLGLTILMNNCNEKSFGDYFRFYKHISYESILRCNVTPVVKRRCLCGIAKTIGFSKEAVENYKYINQVGIYRLIDPSCIKRGKIVSSLENTTRLKLPFPNMICNIHQDVTTGGHQVFSSGTADLILDACVDYWNGKELAPLDDSAKKKILDFYHRTSLTSYCSAFSYTPLMKSHKLHDHFIELPPENPKSTAQLRKIANVNDDEYFRNQLICLAPPSLPVGSARNSSQGPDVLDSDKGQSTTKKISQVHLTRRYLSAENLSKLDEAKKTNHSTKRSSKKHRKLDDSLDELIDQVFVGMVAMQYQAFPDFVALREQLEHACIRFVHFSKENELRSRVFSEKMGLESGWNCHISLQSDQALDGAVVGDCLGSSKVQKQTQDIEDPSKFSYFKPNLRVSNILVGTQMQDRSLKKSCDDVTSREGSISSDEQTLYSWKSLPSLVMKLASKISPVHHIIDSEHNSKSQNPLELHPSSGGGFASGSEFGDELDQGVQADLSDESTKDEGFQSLAFDMSNRAKLPKGIENIRPHLETVDNVPLQVSLFTDCTPDLTQEMIEIMQDYGEIVCVIGSSSSRLNTPIFLQANVSIAIEPLVPQSCMRHDSKIRRSLDRKMRKKLVNEKKRKSKHQLITPKIIKSDEDGDFTAINMKKRPNNPRDRLGIGPAEPSKQVLKQKPKLESSSSSSSSSSPASSSCSSSSSECDSNDELLTDDEIINSPDDGNIKPSKLSLELPAPSTLASKLASLPCSYSYNRKDQVNLYSLIMEARHFTFKMKNTFVCMICFALSISSAQFLASILFLPPMLSAGLTIWLTVVVVPLQSFSLMSTTMDSQVMKIAVGKNLQLKPENITFFVICYLIKFIPSIIVVVLSFGLIIAHSCKLTGFGSSSLGPCWMFTYVQHGNATSADTGDEDLIWSTHLLTAQVSAAFLLVLYFVVISSGFVHRTHLFWQRSPTRNRLWVAISLLLIFGQLFYNQLVLQVNLGSSRISYEFLTSLPLHIWVISFMWPILVIGINLMVKRAEIKATIRQQRRARFDFNTKLGMNSPF